MKKDLAKNIYHKPLIWMMVFFLLAAVCISFPAKLLIDEKTTYWAPAVIRMLFGASGIILMIKSGYAESLKIRKRSFKAADAVIVALLVAINNFPIIALLNGEAKITAGAGTLTSFLLYCVSVGFFEEIFFRGLIFLTLLIYFKDSKQGVFRAIIVSCVLFAAMHFLNLFSGASIGNVLLQVGYTFLNGLLYTLLLYFSGSIWFSVICHILFDVGGMIIEYAGEGEIWNTPTILLTASIGIFAGIYFSVKFIRQQKKAVVEKQYVDMAGPQC